MSLDKRIETTYRPCFGCHSDLDHYKKEPPPPCTVDGRHEEKACKGCSRVSDGQQEGKE